MLYKNLVINGKEFKLAVNLTGKGAPTQKTEGQIGSIYMDESSDDKKLYKCTGNLGGSYTWVEFDKNADWGTLLSKPFDKINQAELEVVGMESDRQLGVKAIAKSKVTGLDEKLNEIDQSLLGKQPKGDYSTKTELAEGLDTKVNKTGRTPNKILGVDEGGNVVDVDAPSGIVAQEEAPADTDVLWIDTNDETNPSRIVIDSTLKLEGQAADAKATGDALKKLENLVVYVTKTPLETYTADYNSTEIRNAAISNKKVELRYEDVDTNSGDQVYAFETFKDGEAIFRRNVITATEAYRINIFVDHVGNVRFEKTNLDLSKYALKSEIPAKLPNPYALTFTGASTATYDGTKPVSVNIPQGGSGSDISLAVTGASVGQIVEIEEVDESGKPKRWKAVDKPSGVGESMTRYEVEAEGGEAWLGFTWEDLGITNPYDCKAIRFMGNNLQYDAPEPISQRMVAVQLKPLYSGYGLVLQIAAATNNVTTTGVYRNSFSTSKIDIPFPGKVAPNSNVNPVRMPVMYVGTNNIESTTYKGVAAYAPSNENWYKGTGFWLGLEQNLVFRPGAKFIVDIWR